MSPSASFPLAAAVGPLPATGAAADEAPPPGELVTVTCVYKTLEAEALRGCLQAQGIPATLGDMHTIQTDTLLAHALGGIRVQVPASFAPAAHAVVAAFERGEFAIDDLPPGDEAAPSDPEAESQLGMPRLGALMVALLLLLGLMVALSPGRLIH
jgi:hypothetical protein